MPGHSAIGRWPANSATVADMFIELFRPDQLAFLEAAHVARLATVDELGAPHALPICFVVLEGLLYTPIDEKPKRGDPRSLRRIRNILANPAVCLVVDHYEEDWSRLAWLQVRGDAHVVEDDAERQQALAALRSKHAQYRAMDLESRPLIRITPKRIVGWSATASDPR
jgi:PPOX class probable F420-dependent enzyme